MISNKKPTPQQIADLKKRVAAMSSPKRIEIATKILRESDGKFNQATVAEYLTEMCGLTMEEYLQALNDAGDGELLRVALGGD